MAEKTYSWTVDVEADWGGRTKGTEGIDIGLPLIFKVFKEYNIKGLFFISTEIMENRLSVVRDIVNQGHEIGSHGHFHVPFKEPWRQHQNMNIANNILNSFTEQDYYHFRAPKFSYKMYGHRYSDKQGHIGLLKYMWFGAKLDGSEIFYLHPFDIVGGKKSPNLFTHIWYSNPRRAYETFVRLASLYPGCRRLVQDNA